MVDDKDGSAPDPWEGIGEDAGGDAGENFSFSFDATGDVEENPFADMEPQTTPAGLEADPGLDVTPQPSAETAAAADDIASWLDEPEAQASAADIVAGVFEESVPSGDDEIAASDPIPEDATLADLGLDDLHVGSESAATGSSHVEVGTGTSGVVSPSQVDPVSDLSAADEWGDAIPQDTALDDFATDEQPSFDASGFEGVSESGEAPANAGDDVGVAAEFAAAGAVAAAAAPVARSRPARAKGGGIGQIIGIVLGGLMAIPITYAILIWGFQRDPFKLAELVPEPVAFLLPQKLQPGFKKVAIAKGDGGSPLDNLPEPAPTEPEPTAELASTAEPPPTPTPEPAPMREQPLSAEDVLAEATKPATPAVEEPMPEVEPAPSRPMPADELFAEAAPPPAAPQAEPEPLDLSDLDAAVAEATAAFEEVAASDPESPDRRKLLVGWYKRLAAVAEQLVLVEKLAADSGRSYAEALDGIEAIGSAVRADAAMRGELERLSGMWLSSRKRPADGAVLLATFDGGRQVGPYWSARVTVPGDEPRSVAVISRAEPKAEPGATVMVTGVLFDGDVVWASDVRPLKKPAAPVEELF